MSNEAVTALDKELDRATCSIAREFMRMKMDRMASEADILATALANDLIYADDFES